MDEIDTISLMENALLAAAKHDSISFYSVA
jgi:hypothetical protein